MSLSALGKDRVETSAVDCMDAELEPYGHVLLDASTGIAANEARNSSLLIALNDLLLNGAESTDVVAAEAEVETAAEMEEVDDEDEDEEDEAEAVELRVDANAMIGFDDDADEEDDDEVEFDEDCIESCLSDSSSPTSGVRSSINTFFFTEAADAEDDSPPFLLPPFSSGLSFNSRSVCCSYCSRAACAFDNEGIRISAEGFVDIFFSFSSRSCFIFCRNVSRSISASVFCCDGCVPTYVFRCRHEFIRSMQ